MLCTDGLWNLLAGAAELAALVAMGAAPLSVAERLVATALGRGGHDNVTVAVDRRRTRRALMEFRAETYQNEYLPEGATAVDAIVTVTATGGARRRDRRSAPSAPSWSCSTCPGRCSPGESSIAARTRRGRDRLPSRRCALRGSWPGPPRPGPLPGGGFARADARTRAGGVAGRAGHRADGGTAIGTWLMSARHRLAPFPGPTRNVTC